MGFDDIEVQTGGKYLRLNDGEVAHFHIVCKEPKIAMVHGYGKETTVCEGQGCPQCAEASADEKKKARQRFSINVLNRKTNTIQIFEFGPGIASDIKEIAIALKEMGQSIHDIDLRVKRSKESGKVSYKVIQLPKSAEVTKYFDKFTDLTGESEDQVPF